MWCRLNNVCQKWSVAHTGIYATLSRHNITLVDFWFLFRSQGFCESGVTFSGRCSADVSLCAAQVSTIEFQPASREFKLTTKRRMLQSKVGQTEVPHVTCGSQSCNIDTACQVRRRRRRRCVLLGCRVTSFSQRNTALTANAMAAVCAVDVVVNRCTDIACSTFVKGWNAYAI